MLCCFFGKNVVSRIWRMDVKTDEMILALTYQHVACLHEEVHNRKWKSVRDPVHFWHYLICFDPADTETEVYGQTTEVQLLLWQQHWTQKQGSKRTTPACDRASSVSWVTVPGKPWRHCCPDQEVSPRFQKVSHFSLPVPLHWNQYSCPIMHKLAERHSFTTATGRWEPWCRKVQGKAIYFSVIYSKPNAKLQTNIKQRGRWHI